jgi:hypothetical protein
VNSTPVSPLRPPSSERNLRKIGKSATAMIRPHITGIRNGWKMRKHHTAMIAISATWMKMSVALRRSFGSVGASATLSMVLPY